MFALTRQDTTVLKGIAICGAMLCHHLYTGADIIGDIVPYTGIIEWIGTLGKVCVAMFLFCSGYGLTAQYNPAKSILDDVRFVLRRLVKFYANYWIIFVIFVPITIYVFHRPLSAAYGEHVNIAKCLVYDLLGVQGFNSYNITWWFNQLIIILYLLFPMLYRIVRIRPWGAILLGMVFARISTHLPYNPADICTWLLPFVIGIVWKLYEEKLPTVQEWLANHQNIFAALSIILLGVLIIVRMYPVIPHWSGIRVDGFLTCAIVLCLISILRKTKYVMCTFEFLGKHSLNMYMTHTFLNAYWFPEWLHDGEWLRGGANFLILIALCLSISVALEQIKQVIGVYKVVNRINNKL